MFLGPELHDVITVEVTKPKKNKTKQRKKKQQLSLIWISWPLVSPSLLYLVAQAFSTSAMVFGASEDRIRGPPLSRITTSSSILMPRPRKGSGAWSSCSQTYNPVTRTENWKTHGRRKNMSFADHRELKIVCTWFYRNGHSWL